MEGSVLIVNIIEARDLKQTKMGGGISPYVELFLDTEHQRSTLKDGSEPVWNEKFTLYK